MTSSRLALLGLATALVGGVAFFVLDATGTDASPPCNAYYPVPPGASWTYREGPLDGKPRIEKVVRVLTTEEGEGDRRTALLEQSVRTPGAPGVAAGQARTRVHCDRGRIGLTIEGAAQGREGDRTSTGSVRAEIPGLPPADVLVPGYTWTSKSIIRAREAGVESITEGRRESRVAAIEAVSVPAGHFADALKIVAIEDLTQRGAARSARQELVEWYARGVGLVMRETRVQSGEQTATSVEVLVASSLFAKR